MNDSVGQIELCFWQPNAIKGLGSSISNDK
jgi:hypothetical protein